MYIVLFLFNNRSLNLRRIFKLIFSPLLRTLKSDLLRWDKETSTFGLVARVF